MQTADVSSLERLLTLASFDRPQDARVYAMLTSSSNYKLGPINRAIAVRRACSAFERNGCSKVTDPIFAANFNRITIIDGCRLAHDDVESFQRQLCSCSPGASSCQRWRNRYQREHGRTRAICPPGTVEGTPIGVVEPRPAGVIAPDRRGTTRLRALAPAFASPADIDKGLGRIEQAICRVHCHKEN